MNFRAIKSPEETAERAAEHLSGLTALTEELQRRVNARGEKGKLGLPPLLEKRRREHLIPSGAFSCQPSFDHIFLYQIADEDSVGGATFVKGGLLVKPDVMRDNDKKASPRGIIVAAGATAMDQLRSHGIDLGHIVRFNRFIPYRFEIDNVLGNRFEVLSMRAVSVTGSEDLEQAKRLGLVALKWDEASGQHVWVDKKTKKVWVPRDTQVFADQQE